MSALMIAAQSVANIIGGSAEKDDNFYGYCVNLTGVRSYPIVLTSDRARLRVRPNLSIADAAGSSVYVSDVSDGGYPEITVSAEKSPEKIAADIRRRLLPESDIVWALLVARVAERNDQHSLADQAAEKFRALAGAAGVSVSTGHRGPREFWHRYGSAEAVGDGKIHLHLHSLCLTPEAAVEVLRLIGGAS